MILYSCFFYTTKADSINENNYGNIIAKYTVITETGLSQHCGNLCKMT